MHDVYLGLGGNIGEPRRAMQMVLRALDARPDTAVVTVSSLYRTPPWGKLDQPDFLNAVALVRTSLDPRALLEQCLTIERALKRVRAERWGPRSIDVDILLYGTRTVDDEGLTIPHPRMSERAFVLAPLAEIAPALEIAGRNVETLLESLDRSGVERITPDGEWWKFEEITKGG
ncbi:2-amino-4-hydroxy-6-hydroxymethyldihydropteridine diphosphokinase [uncultured Nitratireductor sp.]|uniref:2-amino-4-hydroxy-6- hydroxymethyldihydropteridine diphosphokinase n=1 Tax=uncultured Nitratireductor sp. TaxID=520953 RepID=UPI0025DA4FBA|nr:2-amino-4-hydroxy-6-hydroxymethyldihydropteridine diphosphokinase [uncultured Nitratireductor sp.]